MFNLKVSGIIAGIAFILSFIIGLISRISLPMILLRAALFSVIFLMLSFLVKFLVTNFLPELLDGLSMDRNQAARPGSRVNITEGEDYFGVGAAASPVSPDFAQPAREPAAVGAQPDESEGGLGNISDLLGKSGLSYDDSPHTGMDHNDQDGYTEDEGLGLFSASSLAAPHRSSQSRQNGSSGGIMEGNPNSMDALPDLDSMAGVFAPASGNTDSGTVEYSASAPAAPKTSLKGKSPEWSGDFNAKDLAAGLRTILNKDKEG